LARLPKGLCERIWWQPNAAARRASEQEIFRRYHDRMVADGASLYTPAQLHDDLRLALLAHLGGTVMWLGSVVLDDLTGRERALVEDVVASGQLFAALCDYAVDGHLPR